LTGEGGGGQVPRGTHPAGAASRKRGANRWNGTRRGRGKSSRFRGRFRVLHVKFFQSLHDDAGNGEITEPFMVGRNDEPGRVFGAAAGKDSLVGGDVIVTALSFRSIRLGKFPFFARIVEPLPK